MKARYQALLNERLADYFSRYAGGLDVTPAMQLGTEGYIRAGLDLALITAEELAYLKQQAYRQAFTEVDSRVLAGLDGECCLPSLMKRAPVKPSTS